MSRIPYHILSNIFFVILAACTAIMHVSPGFFALSIVLAIATMVSLMIGEKFDRHQFTNSPLWFIPLQALLFLAYLINFILWGCTHAPVHYSITVETIVLLAVLMWLPMFALLHHGATFILSARRLHNARLDILKKG